MNVKRYIAKDMSEAKDRIREELGVDAVILHNRIIRKKGIRRFFTSPLVEVVVAYENKSTDKSQTFKLQDRKKLDVSSLDDKRASELIQGLNAAVAQARKKIDKEENSKTQVEKKDSFSNVLKKEKDGVDVLLTKSAQAVTRAYNFPELQQKSVIEEKDNNDNENVGSVSLKDIDERVNELHTMVSKLLEKRAKVHTEAAVNNKVKTLPSKKQYESFDSNDGIYEQLIEIDVDNSAARAIADAAAEKAIDYDLSILQSSRQVMCDMIGDSQPISVQANKQTVVMMVGPTGVGKTTSLIKLASHYALEENLSVGLINADTYRLAAQEQLSAYAEIMDVPLKAVYAPEEIVGALKEFSDLDIVFIDTSGKKPTDKQHTKNIERMIRLSGADQVFLVMSATCSKRACKEIVENYNNIDGLKLIITKTDETSSFAGVVNATIIANRPLGYIATGQNVPDDIKVADIDEIVGSTLEEAYPCMSKLVN